ncbi:hypothetical protein Val02_81760 [Virgisporangium aliadipatigenens]|uniref:Uncharacterized protein n=1 Tax=Virgisporangium aliadipatigenens TaxID=741659 RepID=A0A8J3YWZ0_9ACTN|nr:hypothetical protein [Virgisporangium aliadipatigenens]GIJ51290.1 hypothetical protein Val02_81760 [Virgisporangium aliadipatigenens]
MTVLPFPSWLFCTVATIGALVIFLMCWVLWTDGREIRQLGRDLAQAAEDLEEARGERDAERERIAAITGQFVRLKADLEGRQRPPARAPRRGLAEDKALMARANDYYERIGPR